MTAAHAADPNRPDRPNRSRRLVWLALCLGVGLAWALISPAAPDAAAAPSGEAAESRSSEKRDAAKNGAGGLTATTVYERVYEAYEALETVRLRLTIEQLIAETGTPSTITGILYASKSEGIVRFEILTPDVLEDQIVVVSSEDEMVRTYVPVTERVVERPLSEVAHDRMEPDQWQSIDELLRLPSIDDFQFKLVGTPSALHVPPGGDRYKEGVEQSGERHVLDVRPKEHSELGVQRFWVDPSLWLPTEVAALDEDGVEMYHLYVDQIEKNVEISREDLTRMP